MGTDQPAQTIDQYAASPAFKEYLKSPRHARDMRIINDQEKGDLSPEIMEFYRLMTKKKAQEKAKQDAILNDIDLDLDSPKKTGASPAPSPAPASSPDEP